MKYKIILKDNSVNISDNILAIVNYLGDDKCFSTYYNYYLKYTSKTRDINIEKYLPLSIEKYTNNIFDNNLIKGLASNFINESFLDIEAELNDVQLEYLKTLESIKDIERIYKKTIKTQSTSVGDNNYSNYINNAPNTNFSLQVQNLEFVNDTEKKIFNYTKDNINKVYTYTPPQITESIDIIVVDGGIHGLHENFFIDGVNICKIEEQKNRPWQLSKLLKLAKVNFIEDTRTPEGVNKNDKNFYSYFTPDSINDYNHGTHCAGIICGKNTGWIRSKFVNLYCIPLIFIQNISSLIELLMELSILDFQITKLKNNDNTPTFINRSYGSSDSDPNFPISNSNFSGLYNNSNFNLYYDNNSNLCFKEKKKIFFVIEIQKKFQIFNFFSGGNDNELQLKWSDNPNNLFNYALIKRDKTIEYPYIPSYTCIKQKFWTINKKTLDNFTLQDFFFNYTLTNLIEINYDLIQKELNNNTNVIFKILNEQSSFIVGSLCLTSSSQSAKVFLKEKNVEYFSNYCISAFSSFGNGLIYSLGGNIRSCISTDYEENIPNNLYDNYGGTSMACPNLLAIVAIYVMKTQPRVNLIIDNIIKLFFLPSLNPKDHIYCPVPIINPKTGQLSVIDLWNLETSEYLLKDIMIRHKINDIKKIYPLSHPTSFVQPIIVDSDLTKLSLVIKSSDVSNSFLKLIKNNNTDNLNKHLSQTALALAQLAKDIQTDMIPSEIYNFAAKTADASINAAKASENKI